MALQWLRQTSDGWIVTLDDSGSRRSLPSHIELDLTGTISGRDHFKVIEGIYAGKNGSIAGGSGLLTVTNPHLSPATIRYRNRTGGPTTIAGVKYDKEILIEYENGGTTQSSGPFNALSDQSNPIPLGTHILQVPDYPHEDGASYSQYGTVWFRIGSSGDRYLHPGGISSGCITVQGINWVQVYETIINRRDTASNIGKIIAT